MSSTQRVGQIVGAFGIKGQVKVKLLTDFEKRFHKGRRLLFNGEWTVIRDMMEHKGMVILTLDAIPDRTAAENAQWAYLDASADELPELDEDEFLTSDLIDLEVRLESGEVLGKVDAVHDYPAHDVIQVGDIMIPAVAEFVLDIDLDAEVMIVRLIPGMRGEDDVS